MTVEIALKKCVVQGNVVKLPGEQLDRKVYEQLATLLKKIGGTWNRKAQGFVFESDPTELLADIQGGKARNVKKDFQFYETPDKVADDLVKLADISATHRILEPSAGRGAIVRAILRKLSPMAPAFGISICEVMPDNIRALQQIPHVGFMNKLNSDAPFDFLSLVPDGSEEFHYFDKIIANPPFTKNQDIKHIRHMYSLLKPGGRIVSICSIHFKNSSGKIEMLFEAWLRELRAQVIDLPAGEFKKSGTNVPTCIIVIDKPVN